jgi:hypothetical protein
MSSVAGNPSEGNALRSHADVKTNVSRACTYRDTYPLRTTSSSRRHYYGLPADYTFPEYALATEDIYTSRRHMGPEYLACFFWFRCCDQAFASDLEGRVSWLRHVLDHLQQKERAQPPEFWNCGFCGAEYGADWVLIFSHALDHIQNGEQRLDLDLLNLLVRRDIITQEELSVAMRPCANNHADGDIRDIAYTLRRPIHVAAHQSHPPDPFMYTEVASGMRRPITPLSYPYHDGNPTSASTVRTPSHANRPSERNFEIQVASRSALDSPLTLEPDQPPLQILEHAETPNSPNPSPHPIKPGGSSVDPNIEPTTEVRSLVKIQSRSELIS